MATRHVLRDALGNELRIHDIVELELRYGDDVEVVDGEIVAWLGNGLVEVWLGKRNSIAIKSDRVWRSDVNGAA